MDVGPAIGIIYGIILLIIGALGVYDTDTYLNNINMGYLLLKLGIIALIVGGYFSIKKK